ncbi:MAG: hypothetical protein GY711_17125 [bacterium]|nr:hypothetical protein [bacterium]
MGWIHRLACLLTVLAPALENRETLLHDAVAGAGADVNARTLLGETPLTLARHSVFGVQPEIQQFLVDHGGTH